MVFDGQFQGFLEVSVPDGQFILFFRLPLYLLDACVIGVPMGGSTAIGLLLGVGGVPGGFDAVLALDREGGFELGLRLLDVRGLLELLQLILF
jgi:hypothetical protein